MLAASKRSDLHESRRLHFHSQDGATVNLATKMRVTLIRTEFPFDELLCGYCGTVGTATVLHRSFVCPISICRRKNSVLSSLLLFLVRADLEFQKPGLTGTWSKATAACCRNYVIFFTKITISPSFTPEIQRYIRKLNTVSISSLRYHRVANRRRACVCDETPYYVLSVQLYSINWTGFINFRNYL